MRLAIVVLVLGPLVSGPVRAEYLWIEPWQVDGGPSGLSNPGLLAVGR